MRIRNSICLVFFLGLLAARASLPAPVLAATLPNGFTETLVAGGLAHPTALELAPDGRIFVAEQDGALRVIKNDALLAAPFVSLNVTSGGERGLLGIAFDPDFAVNQYVYVYYTTATAPLHNRVSRLTANGDVVVPGSEVVILDLENLSSATNHNGGGIHFAPDGTLYVGVGENANPSNSQTLTNRLGKILRINADGTLPADNPFYDVAAGANRAIWALGLRNPYTFAFQPGSGRLFINDVGQNTWEEIDDGRAGSNYGWPNCEGFCNPPNPNFRDPLLAYGHGGGSATGCAISGGAFYNPTTAQFPANYVGKYFFADYCSAWIRVLDPTTKTASAFATGASSLTVDLKVDGAGNLYYLARGSGSNTGVVYRIQYAAIPMTTLEETDPALQWNGWRGVSDASASGGAYRVSNVSNDKVTFKFSGAAITWVSRKGPEQGMARVTIDGVVKCTCDLYSAGVEPAAQITFSGLANKRHTIVVQVLGVKNPSASDTKVVVDAFGVGANPPLEEDARALTFDGWGGAVNANASGGAYRHARASTAVARVNFTGTRVEWITAKGPAFGKAQVLIDGVVQETLDLYAASARWNVARSYTGLSDAAHTLQIRVLGVKRAASTGTRVVVDAVRVP